MKEAIADTSPSRRIRLRNYLAASIIFVLFADLLLLIFARGRFPLGISLLASFLCLDSYLALFVLLGHESVQLFIQKQIARHSKFPLLFLLVLFIPHLVYAVGTHSFSILSALKLLIYFALPFGKSEPVIRRFQIGLLRDLYPGHC